MGNQKYTIQDFKSDQQVKWCPGCGDHAILNSVYRALPEVSEEFGYNKERFVFVSGIGCSSRFPYYLDTYGFHGIHGRAAAIASGMKVANPELSIWETTGDGDSLAIGGNHFIHAIRRNIDINIILFNNEIYGLTKGQYSPTSKLGAVTKTSPHGTVEQPFRPGELVIGAQGKFFARSIDADIKLTAEILVEAAKHNGTSVVVIQQNCVIYNDKTHAEIVDRETRMDRTIVLRHGEKMIFGKNSDKGLVMDGGQLKAVTIGEDGYTMDDVLVHNAHNPNPGLHVMLTNMSYPELPLALGVIRAAKFPTYNDNICAQLEEIQKSAKINSMDELLNSGDIYEVK
ncbi:MAG: 2-oxoacid:ferredoxin oxidoreductase subunit beta [Perlabentimonas sp.]